MGKKNLGLSRKLHTVLKPFRKTASKMHKRLYKRFGKATSPVMFISAFAVVGALTMLIVRAAPYTTHFEAENANRSGSASATSAPGASGDSALRFGSGSTGGGGCADGPLLRMGFCVRQASIQPPVAGTSSVHRERVLSSNYGGYPLDQGDGDGAFRTDCRVSHTSKNDPIVYPGGKDAAHWHVFYGNTMMDENTNDANIRTRGNSTCFGGSVNKTGYWAPALIDTNSYNPATKEFDIVPALDDPVRRIFGLQIYYKAGLFGINSGDLEWFPPGLKMIAGGNPNTAPTGPSATLREPWKRVDFGCLPPNSGRTDVFYQGMAHLDRIPANCPPGHSIQASVTFPQCGAVHPDGRPVLDTSEDPARYPNNDHRSHMTYPPEPTRDGRVGANKCPASHPRTYPEIKEHFRWVVPATGSSGLRFSSDIYEGVPAGWTFHADWYNGWDPAIAQSIVDTCYHVAAPSGQTGVDCGMNIMGPHPNGGWWLLTDPQY